METKKPEKAKISNKGRFKTIKVSIVCPKKKEPIELEKIPMLAINIVLSKDDFAFLKIRCPLCGGIHHIYCEPTS